MKKRFIICGLAIATLGALLVTNNTYKTEDLVESVDSNYNVVNALSLKETKIGASEEVSISETYSQWGKNEDTGRLVLRFATAISGPIKSATYTRAAFDGKEANIKEVSTVYAGIEDGNGTAYYTSEGLSYTRPEAITHYWAIYVIEFSENSAYKAQDINMTFNAVSEENEEIVRTKTTSLQDSLAATGDYYLLPKRTNSETIANPGKWGYNSPEGAKFDIAPCYELGKIIIGLSANNVSGDHQLRFQPNVPSGTGVVVKAKVSYEGNGYFLYGNDYKNSKDLTPDANGIYTIDWTGTASSTPFYFTFRSNDSFKTALKLVVHEFSYEAIVADDGESYDIQKKTNSETCAAPGIWAYTAPTGAKFAETPRMEKGVITFATSDANVAGDYQLRFQPDLASGTAYSVYAKVKFEGNGYFLYGNDYKNAKDLTPDANGVYTISWNGTVSTTPFYFVLKSNDSFATGLKIVVSDFSYQEK